jgi:hypothetical protein
MFAKLRPRWRRPFEFITVASDVLLRIMDAIAGGDHASIIWTTSSHTCQTNLKQDSHSRGRQLWEQRGFENRFMARLERDIRRLRQRSANMHPVLLDSSVRQWLQPEEGATRKARQSPN